MDPSSDDQGRKILISTWTLAGLSFVFLAARLYCKWRAKRGLWWDDWVLLVSWICLLGSVITVSWCVPRGIGKHIYVVPVENLAILGLVGNVTGTLSILAAVWSKTSFALTLLRLMQGRMKILIWVIIVTCNIAMGLNALFIWVRCSPPSKTWNIFEPGTCWEPQVYPNFGMFAAGYSAAMDFVLALLPWQIIWNLQMKRKEKFGVAVAMSMGIFAGATAVVKTAEIPSLASGDFTYYLTGLIIWGAAESAVTIMAASIPVLRTLFRDLKASSRKYYGSRKIEDSASTRFESRHSVKGDVTVALSDLERQHSHCSRESSRRELRPNIHVQHPDMPYDPKNFQRRGLDGSERG